LKKNSSTFSASWTRSFNVFEMPSYNRDMESPTNVASFFREPLEIVIRLVLET
jgi:hypothetical protein